MDNNILQDISFHMGIPCCVGHKIKHKSCQYIDFIIMKVVVFILKNTGNKWKIKEAEL